MSVIFIFRIMKILSIILFVEYANCKDVQYFSTEGGMVTDYSENGANIPDYVTLTNDPKSNLPEENIIEKIVVCEQTFKS